MRKINYFFIALLAVVFVACSGSSPSGVVKDYLGNMKAGNYEQAIKMLNFGDNSSEAQEQLAALAGKMQESMDEVDGIKSYEIVSEEINETKDQAKVVAKVTYGDGSEDDMNMTLRKVDGNWLIIPMEK